MKKIFLLTLKAGLITALCFSMGCSEQTQNTVADQASVTDSLVNRLVIDTVQQASGKSELIFSARITPNEDRKAELFPLVSGSVNRVVARLGDRVRSGQTLATLVSSEMAGFDKEVISADAELRNADRALHQAQQLFESGLASAKEWEMAKNDYQIKKAELKRASSVLKLNGGSQNGLYTIKSPINGFVIAKNVTDNMQLRSDNDQSLFTVADLSNVWALINIYESDIAQVRPGDDVLLTTLSYPDRVFEGKIDKLYNMIDQNSKVMHARVVIANPDFSLKPGMMGTVKVATHTEASLPSVNARAVIFDDNKNYVLLLDNHQKIRIQQIEIGRKTKDKIFTKSGIQPGDRVIASRQVFLFERLKNQ